ncbi:unnamed protein product [Dovyalis caffra]|uniref:Leucine-rich repeat-containing N-terminal plant-type domain-containing protein n=1 Tax=Dovyalis caffra TaxID=77055 RepID=A0AAV1RTD4_9ROSI|nr:unnamed protein product [Dovyalis caffra]
MGPPHCEPATQNGPLRSPINAKRGYHFFQAEAVVVQMEIRRLSLVVVVIGILLLSEGCLEEERIALLQIKTSFYSSNGISFQHYSLGKYANCCNWEGVFCNATTGRVVRIDLLYKRLADWYLNATLFLPFQELNSLNLSGNNILGSVENEGFERLSKLGNLETLYLSYNKFSNSILTSLSALSSLKSLDLSKNRLKGSINIEELHRLRRLEELNVADNEIEGFKSFHNGDALPKLSNLKYLCLSGNRFNNNILSSIKDLFSLIDLDLSYNQLKGSFNMKELDALINLTNVVLDGNEIDKFVFSEDSRGFPNLSYISLYNMTTNGGSISFSLLRSLAKFPNLRSLVLGWNHFDGTILAQGD